MKKSKFRVSFLAGLMTVLMVLSMTLETIPTPVSAASSSEIREQIKDLKAEKEEIAEKIKEIQGQFDANADEIEKLVGQKDAIDQEISLLHEQVDNINMQLSAYALLIADKQDELDNAQQKLRSLSEKNKERIRAMEKNGKLSYWSILFKAHSFLSRTHHTIKATFLRQCRQTFCIICR